MQKSNLHISIDGGALTRDPDRQFGNYVFTTQLLQAIAAYDRKNRYTLYLQEEAGITLPENIKPRVLRPTRGWLKLRVSFEEIFRPKKIFLALNQALPITTPALKIAFCHGLAAIHFPTLYPDSAVKLNRQLKMMLRKADYLIVSSQIVKTELTTKFGLTQKAAKKIMVLPYGVSLGDQSPKKFKKKRVLLCIVSNHPIKNWHFAIESFLELIKDTKFSQYKLLLVGIEKKDLPFSLQNHASILAIGHQPHSALNKFYQEAECLLTTSRYESFNFPVLEALANGTQVVGIDSAIIPELKPFVKTTKLSIKKFVQTLKQVLLKPQQINQTKLRRIFSWEQYILNLKKLYAKEN